MNENKQVFFLKNKEKIKGFGLFLIISFFLFCLDFITKKLVVEKVINFNFYNIIKTELIYNSGGIFGIGNKKLEIKTFLIIARIVIFIIATVCYYFFQDKLETKQKFFLMLIYAGNIGNLIDSFYFEKGVVDWIRVIFFPYVFNLADCFICVGTFLLVIFSFL